jgi:1-acyl-sn-glycerol-3-phosphate acyltransferase
MTLAFSLRTNGEQNMPQSGAALIVSNHESYLDPVLVGLAVRRPIRYLARKTLFRSALFTRLITSLGAVPVDHESAGASEGLKISIRLLQEGQPLVVFPEGERTHDGTLQEFKPGLLLILRRAPVPIVPVGIAGAYEAFPRSSKFPALSPFFLSATGSSIAVSVGRPIAPESILGLEREEALGRLKGAVAEQVRIAERIVKK